MAVPPESEALKARDTLRLSTEGTLPSCTFPLCKGSRIRETFVCGYVDFGLCNPENRTGNPESKGAFHLTELAGRNMAGPVSLKMKSAFSKSFFLKTHLLRAYYLGFD